MKWLLFAVPMIILTTTLAFQTQRVDYNALKSAAKGSEWLTYGQGYYEQRYSTLTQINASNVGQLTQAWAYDIGPGIGTKQETTPLYANGVLYGVTNWSIAFAVDARTGKEIWRYEPTIDPAMKANPGSRLCCGVLSRGLALYEGKIFVPVIDGRLEALDAATGKVLWSSRAIPETKEGEISAYAVTMAPRAANGKVFIGNAGGEFQPFRGYVSAFDANTGKEAWKFYITPGDPSKGFENKAMEAAAKTWAGEWWKYGGGGSIWDSMSIDPDANLLYVGTGNGGPWALDIRNVKGSKHDNLYVASIIAIDMTTGQLKWHYQCTPGDQWDYDAVQQLTLADIQIDGKTRKVVMQANKNGFFYVIDRITGEFISGAPMSLVSWAKGLDPKTGRPQIVDEAYYTAERGVTVHPVQMHNSSPMSYSPETGLVYVSISPDSTFSFTAATSYTPTPGRQNFGLNLGRGGAPVANPPTWGPVRQGGGGRGAILSAWDPVTQKERWFASGGSITDGGVFTTASNLVFHMQPSGRLYVYSADKGERIADLQVGQNGAGAPITYMLDGKQYIAFMAGTGAAAGRGGGGFGGGGGAAPGGGAGRGGRGGAGAPGAPGGGAGRGGPGAPGGGRGGPGGPGGAGGAGGFGGGGFGGGAGAGGFGGNNFAAAQGRGAPAPQGEPTAAAAQGFGGGGGGRGPGAPGGAAPGGGGPRLYAFTLNTAK
ncbi:MAG TPA: PQQ-dependent dehydrogenase, methanol/ethanol family [Terriglobia bacterium]|nr:PQQ-dependent dehydrogenase, methanol/ethanol family [Terriglobia bacterium]